MFSHLEVPVVRNLGLAKFLWGMTAALAFLSALAGLLFRDIYVNLVPPQFLPGAFPQDILTLLVSAALLILIPGTRRNDVKKQVVILGLMGSFFYLYGIFTMERTYNWCYVLYAAVFASSFWSLISSLSGFRPADFTAMQYSRRVIVTTAVSSIAIAIIFTALWISALIPLMREHNRIEYLYSIYILDLCFVMPAFFITAVMALRGKSFGILMAPAIMILGFFVIFPLGLNELAKPSAGMTMEYGPMAVSFLFAAFMLILAVLQLRSIHNLPGASAP